ncbi:MAG: hypothetical protein VXX85_01265 [Candidatus Margulisiibacteriota bacterium]|nr:hypothetical protein [Candidatus Margulisiibacteriota bacterium]
MISKICGVMIIIMALPCLGLRVELSNDTFATSGRSANRNLFITNNSEKMIALEVYAQSRQMDSVTGVDQLEDVEDFLIYPNQLLLQPDEQQVVTLTWVGAQTLSDEKAFRIIVEELNLSLGDDELAEDDMTVKLAALTKVIKAAYVAPDGAKPNTYIVNSDIIDDQNNKKIKLTFKNSGTAHEILKQTQIKLTPLDGAGKKLNDESITYIPEELKGVLNILAKSQRVITIDWPDQFSEGVVKVHASL